VAAYIRTVRTASGATAVQIVHGSRRGARDIEHVGSAHDEQELEALKAAAGQRLSAGQGELDLGLDAARGEPVGSGPLQIVSSRMGHLWDGLCAAYDALGFDQAVEGDEVFRQLEGLGGTAVMIESTVGCESPPGDGVVGQAARWA
jgi:hypothetical protein